MNLRSILDLHLKWLRNEEGGKKASLSGVDLSGVNLSGVDLSGADLSRADLSDSNLSKACLYKADLYKTDLSRANLSGANFSGTDLSKADLSFTCIFSFNLGKHFGFYHEGYLKIGCIGMSLMQWEKKYEELGKLSNYTNKEIKLYGSMIKFIKENL